MSTTATNDDYRSISKAAILSLMMAINALLVAAFMVIHPDLSVFLAMLGVVGLGCCIAAVWSLKKYPLELIGWGITKFAIVVSTIAFIGGAGYYSYIYATEVPDNCVRMGFAQLKPERRSLKPIPQSALELDGKRVFVKGFIKPNDREVGLKKFILVGDFGTCCFGGTPKITDMIAVNLQNGLTVDHSFRVVRLAGTFRVNRRRAKHIDNAIPEIVYTLEADYVR